MTPEAEQQEIKRLLQENQRLLTENNSILRSMHRKARLAFWLRLLWALFVVGAMFYVYTNYLQPNYETLRYYYESSRQFPEQLNTLKSLFESVPK